MNRAARTASASIMSSESSNGLSPFVLSASAARYVGAVGNQCAYTILTRCADQPNALKIQVFLMNYFTFLSHNNMHILNS
jgi:hypothetical protein